MRIKDSSGDWENTRALFEIDDLIVYPGSELPLIDALQLGGPGCITATANVNATAISRVVELFDQGDIDAAQQAHEMVRQTRLTIQERALHSCAKALTRNADRRCAVGKCATTPECPCQNRMVRISLRR